jgi:hypothetical protein
MTTVSQIRITKTQDLQQILLFLKTYYKGLSENEIIKRLLCDDFRAKCPLEIFPSEDMSSSLEKELIDIEETDDFAGPFDSAETLISSLKA